jgi:ABC-type multidrug transport system ATPase subunit
MRFNRVIFMDHGRALTSGAPRDLMAGLAGRILELAAEPQMTAREIAVQDVDVEDVHSFGGYLHLRVRSPEGPTKRLPGKLKKAGVSVAHLIPVAPTLEDVFIQLLESEEEANGTARPTA